MAERRLSGLPSMSDADADQLSLQLANKSIAEQKKQSRREAQQGQFNVLEQPHRPSTQTT
eukprot:7190528-Alexandrium_andersonii.AAC.1